MPGVDMFCPVSVRPWIFCFVEARPTHQGITHSLCLTNPSHPPKPTRRGGGVSSSGTTSFNARAVS